MAAKIGSGPERRPLWDWRKEICYFLWGIIDRLVAWKCHFGPVAATECALPHPWPDAFSIHCTEISLFLPQVACGQGMGQFFLFFVICRIRQWKINLKNPIPRCLRSRSVMFLIYFFLFSLVPCGLRPCWWLQPPQHPQSRTCPGLFHGHDEVTLLLHLLSQHDPEAAVARLGWLELRRQRSRDEEQVSKFVYFFFCTVISPQIWKLNIKFEYLNQFFFRFRGEVGVFSSGNSIFTCFNSL